MVPTCRAAGTRALSYLLATTLLATGLAIAPVLERPAGADPTTVEFTYTGSAQSWTVPPGVTEIRVDAWGAQGGGTFGGLGGRAEATVAVTPGQSLQVNVGGQPTNNSGGFGGGGNGANVSATGGGGASDVRRGGSALSNRVVVGAGGGGVGNAATSVVGLGGSGGAPDGSSGEAGACGQFATGASQTAGGSAPIGGATVGSLGQGGVGQSAGTSRGGGGGGGGLYGLFTIDGVVGV
jgi:hypothetical protein